MKPTKKNVTPERYKTIKQVVDTIPSRTRGLKQVYHALGINGSTGSAIKKSKDYEDYKRLTYRPKKKPVVTSSQISSQWVTGYVEQYNPIELIKPVANEDLDRKLEKMMNILLMQNDNLNNILNTVNRIKSKYLEREVK